MATLGGVQIASKYKIKKGKIKPQPTLAVSTITSKQHRMMLVKEQSIQEHQKSHLNRIYVCTSNLLLRVSTASCPCLENVVPTLRK